MTAIQFVPQLLAAIVLAGLISLALVIALLIAAWRLANAARDTRESLSEMRDLGEHARATANHAAALCTTAIDTARRIEEHCALCTGRNREDHDQLSAELRELRRQVA